MAKVGNQKGYQSKGERRNVSRSTRRLMKATEREKFLNKFAAYMKGQNPWFTIENPNKEETNKRMIRVRGNDLYGDPKKRSAYIIKGMASDGQK